MMFVAAEVHPFIDGNGRVTRTMMNAELIGAEVRIITPTVYRNNYLAALRGATHTGHYAALSPMLWFRWALHRRWISRTANAEAELTRTNALRDSTDAEAAGVRLVLPMSLAADGS